MKFKDKKAVKAFIINRLREVTCLELTDFATEHDISSFHVAEEFEQQVYRIEKFFDFPNYEAND